MKKIFAICAMALVAGAMLVSCNKDKNAMTVTFDGAKWTATDFYADVTDIETLDAIYVAGSENYADDNVAYVGGVMGGTVGGTNYNLAHGYAIGYFENANDYQADLTGNWVATAAEQSITALDLNAKTIDAVATQTMKNVVSGKTGVEMEVKMNEATWTDRALAKDGKFAK